MIANKVNTNNKNVIIRDSIFCLYSKNERRNLTWDDIDFENRVINVRNTVYDKPKDNKGRWYIGTTKTKQGTRQINMCETVYNALINYKKKKQYMKKLYGK